MEQRCRLELFRAHDEGLEPSDLTSAVADVLGVAPSAIQSIELVRKALDARRRLKKPTWQLTLDAHIRGAIPRRAQDRFRPAPSSPPAPALESPDVKTTRRTAPVVVVGAGPAGLFAAWWLAKHGAKVVLIERGKPVERRARDFGQLRGRGLLDPESNLCFGEGGAGTYSDGKLTTRKNDPLVREVLARLVEMGAPSRILVDAKPHIGTNLLFGVIKNMRRQLLELGVTIHFEARMNRISTEGGRIVGVDVQSIGQLDAAKVVLAIGHSARDTFEGLLAEGVPMEAKSFAVGVRAEHPQALIDAAQYHLGKAPRPSTLPPADYRLTHQVGQRGVYSFCMCPGGMVVPTATEPGLMVVNGMSSARRSTPFANSGVVVQVDPTDMAALGCGEGPLAGVAFQRMLERRTFEAGQGGYRAPAMRASDLVRGQASGQLAHSHFRPGLVPCDLADVLPPLIHQPLVEAIRRFDRIIPGYGSGEGNLMAVESRTSSPIRIPREPTSFEVPGFRGLFVSGEGPGYAGGIMSAAIDGLRVAHHVLCSLR
ncbi:MAG: FAD-dependent oxidoreductase [Deltaproteobacteria bacterium]|nr:FAD-dependent oxidoreductase [Deltaproteobacteria bacterium]